MEPFYTARGHGAWLDRLRDWYADPNPRFYESVRKAQGSGRYYFEFFSYYLVWVIPVILLMVGVTSLRRGGANKHSNASSSGGYAGTHASLVSGSTGGILSERVRRRAHLWRVTTLRISKTPLWQDSAQGNMHLEGTGLARHIYRAVLMMYRF
jgi:hypothetical protein